jgi:hypothetical protein
MRLGNIPHLSLLETPVGGYEAIERIDGEMLRIAKENAQVIVHRPKQAPIRSDNNAPAIPGQELMTPEYDDYSAGDIEEWQVESDEGEGENMYNTDHEASDSDKASDNDV